MRRINGQSLSQWHHFLWVVIKFGAVGFGSIGVYFITLMALRSWLTNIVFLTAVCYLASAVFNYSLQRYFTFAAARPKAGSWLRYIGLHGICMGLNSGLMFVLVEIFTLSLLPAQFMITALIAGTSFLLSYFWVYR